MNAPKTVDFDLHGLLTVRLRGQDADIACVSRQLGRTPLPSEDSAPEPQLRLRFVDRIELPENELRFLGDGDAAFTESAFVVCKGQKKSRVRVAVPMQDAGGSCELLCERGLASVPLLIPLINLTLLENNVLALHASGFEHQGHGIVATGWSKGGKTAALMAFAKHGATYVGDAWVYLTPDSERFFGIPEPIPVRPWHWRADAKLRARIAPHRRTQVRGLELLAGGLRALTSDGTRHGSSLARGLNRATPIVRRQLGVKVAPHVLFGAERCAPSAVHERTLFMVPHAASEVAVREVRPVDVAERMMPALQEEMAELMRTYHQFRFAFPQERNPRIERSSERQRALLLQVLADKPVYEVRHPRQVHADRLYGALQAAWKGIEW